MEAARVAEWKMVKGGSIIRNNRGGEYGQVLLKHAWERHNGTLLHS